MYWLKAVINRKSRAEFYDVVGNTRHACYVCTLIKELLIIVMIF